MLDRKEHKPTMQKILFAIYSDKDLRSILGFKGGTAAFMFYGLPRFSTDLDFDLLEPEKSEMVFNKILEIIKPFGVTMDAKIKYKMVFARLRYRKGTANIKIEISRVPFKEDKYEIKEYLGVPVLTITQDCMAANKLVAVLGRREMVNRDWFDAWYILKQSWDINEKVITMKTGKSLKEYLGDLVKHLEKNKEEINILHGLGEVLDANQKSFVKNKMLDELLFLLKVAIDNK